MYSDEHPGAFTKTDKPEKVLILSTMSDVKGVLIRCSGDMKAKNLTRFSSISFPYHMVDDMISSNPREGEIEMGGFCPIAEKAGFPLYLNRYGFDPTKATVDGTLSSYNANSPAVALRCSVDTKDFGLGLAPIGWTGYIGSVVAVRFDHPVTVKKILMGPRSARTRRGSSPSMSRPFVISVNSVSSISSLLKRLSGLWKMGMGNWRKRSMQ